MHSFLNQNDTENISSLSNIETESNHKNKNSSSYI